MLPEPDVYLVQALFCSLEMVTKNGCKNKLVQNMVTICGSLCQGPLNFSLGSLCVASFLHTT